jgi:hypothetical protein
LGCLNIERDTTRCFDPVGHEHLLAAGSMPALVLPENERDNPMPVVFVPLELTSKGARNKLSHAE